MGLISVGKNMKKAVVFGGSGFVGSHVADALVKDGHDTTIFDIQPSKYLSPNQRFIHGDILDAKAVKLAVEGMDYVYHFAGQPDIPTSIKDPEHTLQLNIQGTINVLQACILNKIERFLFASTIYVYSDAGGFYKASKKSCEIIIQEYQKNFGLNYTILRYGSLYGPRSDENNFIYRLLKQAILEKKIRVDFDRDAKREYIHVLDAAKMSLYALNEEYINSSVMLTGYQQITCGELIELIHDILGVELKFIEIEKDRSISHYTRTPYIFRPDISKKLVAPYYIEFGQGILSSIEAIYDTYLSETKEDITEN